MHEFLGASLSEPHIDELYGAGCGTSGQLIT